MVQKFSIKFQAEQDGQLEHFISILNTKLDEADISKSIAIPIPKVVEVYEPFVSTNKQMSHETFTVTRYGRLMDIYGDPKEVMEILDSLNTPEVDMKIYS